MPGKQKNNRAALEARAAQLKADIAERTAILQTVTQQLSALDSSQDPLSQAMAAQAKARSEGSLPAPQRFIRGADGKLIAAPTAPPGVYSVPNEPPTHVRPSGVVGTPGASGPGWSPVTQPSPGGTLGYAPRDYPTTEQRTLPPAAPVVGTPEDPWGLGRMNEVLNRR